jgi:hypothetical protein
MKLSLLLLLLVATLSACVARAQPARPYRYRAYGGVVVHPVHPHRRVIVVR